MLRKILFGAALTVVFLLSGCTLHFKASELELDAERQRVETNRTYELEKVSFLAPDNR